MLKKIFIPIAIFAAIASFTSCNSKEDTEQEYVLSSSVEVTGFYIKDNPKVLDSLQNVFFSIDLLNAQIFNADSLPYGTNVRRLIPNITVAGASAIFLEMPRPGMSDSISDYSKNPNDSIDFSNGPVKLRVRSQSGAVERVYTVKVNVHKVKADSLAWQRMERAPMPTTFTAPSAQAAAQMGDTYYCLTANADATSYCMASAKDLAQMDWSIKEITLGFRPQVESLRGTTDALYILDNDGALYKSADGEQWAATGTTCRYLYGAYGSQLLAAVNDNGAWSILSYPSGSLYPMPEGFPVTATSLPAVYETGMSFGPQLVMVGGRTASGSLINGSWSYDGSDWSYLTVGGLSYGLSDMTLVAYDLFALPSSTWRPVAYPALIAMGGRIASGGVNRTVFYSYDWGMNWKKAPDLMQLPAEIKSFYLAKAFVYTSTLHASSKSPSRSWGWTTVNVKRLPPICSFINAPMSRAERPITEWDAPAIYVFGGREWGGEAITDIWRGMIKRYTFQPKQ